MEFVKGENINSIPFRGLKKVTDLIYFDGPILSHFKDEFGKNILFYWVDYNQEVNRWIVLQITENQLYEYLSKKSTLFNLFENPVNDVFYSLEIGVTLEYKNIVQIFKGELPGEYMPEINSHYTFEIPTCYRKNLEKMEDKYAKVIFIKSSLFIKAQPYERGKNLNLVGIIDGANFLYGIGKSFKGLIEFEANNEFYKRGIVDPKRINKASIALVKAMQPNLIEAKTASFAIAISPNSFTDVGETFLNKQWRDNLFNKFKTDIIEIDKKNTEDIDNIVKEYGENYTSDIYKPLIDLYNNKNLVLSITDKDFNPQRTIRPIRKEFVNKLITTTRKEQEEPEDRIAKVKFNKKTGKIAGTSGATLFDQSIYTSWKATEIRTENKIYKLRHQITADYKYENKLHIIEDTELDIYATGDSLPEAETNFYEEFDRLHKRIIEVENINLTQRDIELKRYLQFHLKG